MRVLNAWVGLIGALAIAPGAQAGNAYVNCTNAAVVSTHGGYCCLDSPTCNSGSNCWLRDDNNCADDPPDAWVPIIFSAAISTSGTAAVLTLSGVNLNVKASNRSLCGGQSNLTTPYVTFDGMATTTLSATAMAIAVQLSARPASGSYLVQFNWDDNTAPITAWVDLDSTVAGPQGAIGPTGATGSAGATGPNGATGPQGPMGANGNDGAAGATGPAGPAGSQGTAGTSGAAGQGFDFRSAWDSHTAYYFDDVVIGRDGSSYVSLGSSSGNDPTSTSGYWALFAKAGTNGAQGPQGSAGANGNDGAQGPQGPAGVNGNDGAQGPQGATGATGAAGPQGSAGTCPDVSALIAQVQQMQQQITVLQSQVSQPQTAPYLYTSANEKVGQVLVFNGQYAAEIRLPNGDVIATGGLMIFYSDSACTVGPFANGFLNGSGNEASAFANTVVPVPSQQWYQPAALYQTASTTVSLGSSYLLNGTECQLWDTLPDPYFPMTPYQLPAGTPDLSAALLLDLQFQPPDFFIKFE